MYKFALAAALVAVAQAIKLSIKESEPIEDPFVKMEESENSDRHACCDLPDCADHCPPPETPKPPVPIDINLPPDVQKVEMNIDALLTHILHEQHPDPDPLDPVIPPPGTPSERNFIENVVSPMVIQIVNDDLGPAMPVCTFPGGITPEEAGVDLDDLEMGSRGMGIGHEDPEAAIRRLLATEMSGMDLPQGIDIRDLTNAAIPSQEILDKLNVESEEGKKVLEDIIKGFRGVVDSKVLHQGELYDEWDPTTSADDTMVSKDYLSGDVPEQGVYDEENYEDSEASVRGELE
jgi:hypothetical protein